MPTQDQLINKRVKTSEEAQAVLDAAIKAAQAAAFAQVVSWALEKLETDEAGKIKYTARNFNSVRGLYTLLAREARATNRTALRLILEWAKQILNLNENYFASFVETGTIKEQALFKTLLRWGYNSKTGEILAGGYFESLFATEQLARSVAGVVNKAIAGGITLNKFQVVFKSVFTGPGGMLAKHWRTNSFDLFQRIDRTANLIYADDLKLNWAIYSGTLETDSRPFCIARVNKVFKRTEIEDWKGLRFSGKPNFYDPFTDCGGYNCRHHLSWVSDVVGEKLRENQ